MYTNDITAQSLAYCPVLTPDKDPEAIEYDRDGNTWINLRADYAKTVSMRIGDEEYSFSKTEEGIWRLKYPLKAGFAYVQLLIDGHEVLSPYLPISYGCSRPTNSIPVPEDEDFYRLKDVAHGSVRREYYFSSVTGEWESCMVYTPYVYETQPETSFPVLYLQTGHGENEIGWVYAGKVNFILDNMIAAGEATPFLVVMCDGMVQKPEPRRVVDHTLFTDLLLKDVIPFIEGKFRVKKDRESRAMAGLSMGSMQTCVTTFTHPELFAYVGLFSGFMRDFIRENNEKEITGGSVTNEHLSALDDPQQFYKNYKVFFRGIGKDDVFVERFLEDDKILEEKNVVSTRFMYEGGHDWNVWRRCIRDFAKMIFRAEI